MQNISPCLEYSSGVSVRAAPPACETWRRALYVPVDDLVPWERDPRWGLYDEDGNLIEAAAYFRGPGRNLVGQQLRMEPLSHSNVELAPPGRYLYGGNLIAHYGHFVLSCLSRYWLGLYQDLSQYKIICHGAGTPVSWFSTPFMRYIFEAFGLKSENFVVFKRPTVLPEVLIPRSAAEEHNYTHKAFGVWGEAVGQALLRDLNLQHNDRPVWLAKTRVPVGVQGFENEAALVAILEKEGVEIVHPQELSLVEQVRLFRTRSVIMGAAGSAFHTKIFGSSARLICLNPWPTINSNYALIDEVLGPRIEFFRPETQAPHFDGRRFAGGVDMVDPASVAQDIVSLI